MSEWMEMEQAAVRYSDETPEWMEAFSARLPELQRLRDVGIELRVRVYGLCALSRPSALFALPAQPRRLPDCLAFLYR